MYQCSINTYTRKNNCSFSHCNQLHHENFILKNDLSSGIIFTFMKYKSSCKLILILILMHNMPYEFVLYTSIYVYCILHLQCLYFHMRNICFLMINNNNYYAK